MPHREVALSAAQIEQFVVDGFVRIEDAFPPDLASACRRFLWLASGCAEDEPATWTRPLVRIAESPDPLFVEAANTPRLHAAYDALVGNGRWLRPRTLGAFPIRFPSPDDPGDCGWHVDTSFRTEGEADFLKWRVNVDSQGRALLMFFLFSDVGDDDAPTRLRVGSHVDIARRLEPYGEEGQSLGELARSEFSESAHRSEVTATGPAGTVYLCHPFLVHSAQRLLVGTRPRFFGQGSLRSREPLDRWRGTSPVERAIRMALSHHP